MTSELYIEFRFPGGHYHTTPWDRQVNEGAVEWPPSPWRILRTLISVWHTKVHDDVSNDDFMALISTLSSVAPSWQLPEAVQAHTRHYMPTRDSTTKIFDNFLVVDRARPAVAHWPSIHLDNVAQKALDKLLAAINYLGRSESWVEAKRIEKPEGFTPNAGPIDRFEEVDAHLIIRQLMPMSKESLLQWRSKYRDDKFAYELKGKRISASEKGKDPEKVKLTNKDIEKVEAMLPETPYRVLICETEALQKAGWSQPPGAQWVNYVAPQVPSWTPPKSPAIKGKTDAPTIARYAVASKVPPRLITAIYQTQKLHATLVCYTDGNPIFTGCDAQRRPLKGHQHAFLFAEANDERTDRITHLNVWVPGGIDDNTIREALSPARAHKLWGKDGHDLQLVLLGVGQPEDFAGHDIRAGQSPALMESKVWRSITPFVSTRHPKRRKNGEPKRDEHGRHIGSPEHDLIRLLGERGYPEVESIKPMDRSVNIHGRDVFWLDFATSRNKGSGRRGPSSGCGFEVRFCEPVRGPILVGYGAHFGLGLFVAESSD